MTPSAPDYLVTNKGEEYHGQVKITQDMWGKMTLLYNDSLTFNMNEVRRFENGSGYFAVIQDIKTGSNSAILGSIVLKRVARGNVEVYEKFDFSGRNSNNKPNYDYFNRRNDLIRKVEYDNLKAALKDNEQSMRYLKQYKTYKILNIGLLGLGLATTFYGLVTSSSESGEETQIDPATGKPAGDFKLNSTAYVGIGVTLTSFVPYFLKSSKLKQAIDAYNRN